MINENFISKFGTKQRESREYLQSLGIVGPALEALVKASYEYRHKNRVSALMSAFDNIFQESYENKHDIFHSLIYTELLGPRIGDPISCFLGILPRRGSPVYKTWSETMRKIIQDEPRVVITPEILKIIVRLVGDHISVSSLLLDAIKVTVDHPEAPGSVSILHGASILIADLEMWNSSYNDEIQYHQDHGNPLPDSEDMSSPLLEDVDLPFLEANEEELDSHSILGTISVL